MNDDQVAAVRELVAAGRASSISGFVQHAVGVALFDAAGWRTIPDDALSQTGGALTEKERAWADSFSFLREESHALAATDLVPLNGPDATAVDYC